MPHFYPSTQSRQMIVNNGAYTLETRIQRRRSNNVELLVFRQLRGTQHTRSLGARTAEFENVYAVMAFFDEFGDTLHHAGGKLIVQVRHEDTFLGASAEVQKRGGQAAPASSIGYIPGS
jgi:hypothetical protein